jgi:hypothetical protein
MADGAAPDTGRATSARGMLREWIRLWLREHQGGGASLPGLREEAIAHFSLNSRFMDALLRESVGQVFYAEVQGEVAKTRAHGLIIHGDELVRRDEIARRAFLARRDPRKWAGWLEHASPGKHLLVMDMTREQLLVAAAERRQRGNREHAIARLWVAMADRMEEGQRVREAFGPEDIERLHVQLSGVPNPVTLDPPAAASGGDSLPAVG